MKPREPPIASYALVRIIGTVIVPLVFGSPEDIVSLMEMGMELLSIHPTWKLQVRDREQRVIWTTFIGG